MWLRVVTMWLRCGYMWLRCGYDVVTEREASPDGIHQSQSEVIREASPDRIPQSQSEVIREASPDRIPQSQASSAGSSPGRCSEIRHTRSHKHAVINHARQWSSAVISGHQRSSELIRRHQSRTHMVSSCCESRSVCFEHERASPKSQILSLQLRSTRMLPGLRSRWTTLHRCK